MNGLFESDSNQNMGSLRAQNNSLDLNSEVTEDCPIEALTNMEALNSEPFEPTLDPTVGAPKSPAIVMVDIAEEVVVEEVVNVEEIVVEAPQPARRRGRPPIADPQEREARRHAREKLAARRYRLRRRMEEQQAQLLQDQEEARTDGNNRNILAVIEQIQRMADLVEEYIHIFPPAVQHQFVDCFQRTSEELGSLDL